MSKGSKDRVRNRNHYGANWDRIFGARCLHCKTPWPKVTRGSVEDNTATVPLPQCVNCGGAALDVVD